MQIITTQGQTWTNLSGRIGMAGQKEEKQAGAELYQAQVKLRLVKKIEVVFQFGSLPTILLRLRLTQHSI
jgi:hypothetical protein